MLHYFYVRTRDVFFLFFSTQRHSTKKKATENKSDLHNGKVFVLLSVFFFPLLFVNTERFGTRKRLKYENRKKKGTYITANSVSVLSVCVCYCIFIHIHTHTHACTDTHTLSLFFFYFSIYCSSQLYVCIHIEIDVYFLVHMCTYRYIDIYIKAGISICI